MALWPLVSTVVNLVAVPRDSVTAEADAWLFWMYLSIVVPVMAGLIAAVQVGRARVVQNPWNWAPLWVLTGQVVLWLVPQLVGVAAPSVLLQTPGLLSALGTLSFLAGTLGLGILAVVLANRSTTEPSLSFIQRHRNSSSRFWPTGAFEGRSPYTDVRSVSRALGGVMVASGVLPVSDGSGRQPTRRRRTRQSREPPRREA